MTTQINIFDLLPKIIVCDFCKSDQDIIKKETVNQKWIEYLYYDFCKKCFNDFDKNHKITEGEKWLNEIW